MRGLLKHFAWRGPIKLICVLVVLVLPEVSKSDDHDLVKDLVQDAFSNLYGDDYLQVMELVTHPVAGRGMIRKLQIIRSQSGSPGKALVRFIDPAFLRKTAILIVENNGAFDDLFVYLPAARITRHLRASQRADAFFGTDLSYEDLEPKRVEDYEVQRIGPTGSSEGKCELVEMIPRKVVRSAYERLVSCIGQNPGSFHWIEFYQVGSVVKRLEIKVSSIQRIGNRYYPFEMTMRDVKRGTRTEISTESYEVLTTISDDVFSTVNLETGSARQDRVRAKGAD